jgi:hypothetical protein
MSDVSKVPYETKPQTLAKSNNLATISQNLLFEDPACRIMPGIEPRATLLNSVASSVEGMSTGDGARYQRAFWELDCVGPEWTLYQAAPAITKAYGGLEWVVLWEDGRGALASDPGARVQGLQAWGQPGILVERMSSLRASIYMGQAFQKTTVVVKPSDPSLLPAIWHFCASGQHKDAVLAIERRIGIATSAIINVRFDPEHWRRIAKAAGPMPKPWSDDPAQWLFEGQPEVSTSPLQVALGRLLGYRWPQHQESDDFDSLSDRDGIVCLPSVAGEPPAVERLQQVLASAFGETWSPSKAKKLLEQTGSKRRNLADWLRDEFFKQHSTLFLNRPFIWHIWDGLRDGFSALVNYHRLDRKMLEKLTYTYLGQDWVERQRAGVRDDIAGAEDRLAAALDLQRKLEAILIGEKPFDIYVRWKALHEQPVGWEPDLNDGVRLNIRPFVQAGVLRSPFNIHWKKDRGKNLDGSERHNDLHLSLAEKLEARKKAGRS